MNDFINVINNVGFPIACTIYLAWNQVTHMTKVAETIDRNTRVLERLSLKLDSEELLDEEDL